MRERIWMAAAVVTLVLAGCGQNAPELADSNGSVNNITDANAISGDTVSIDENTYGNTTGTENNTNGGYNSSSNGFQSIYFAFGNYTITGSMQAAMDTNARVAMSGTSRIKIEGNCDEFGTDEYNYALGLKRAKAVRDTLVAQGVSPSRMVIVSFGESSPVCTETSDSCYDQNRRVDLRMSH